MMLRLREVSLRKAEASDSCRAETSKSLVHYGLHVAVAFHAQRLQNALPGNHSHHVAAADHREIILQGMHCLIQRVFERVRRRESREVGKHHFFQAHIVQHRLEDDRAFLKLRRRKDNHAHHGEPGIAEQTRYHQNHGHERG